MKTALTRRLTPDQYDKLCEAVFARRKEVLASQEHIDWTIRRERYERVAAGDHWYRLDANGYGRQAGRDGKGIGTIFDKVNESLRIVQSVRRFLQARVCKDLFGSEPYIYVRPEGASTKDLSLKLQLHSDWKLTQADYVNKMKEAIGIAFDLGECPVKTTWEKKIDLSERMATLLTDQRTGQPVLTANGDHLESSDETTGGDPATDNQGMPVMGPDGQQSINPVSFVKAPEVQIDPANHAWQEHFVEEQSVLYEGLNIATCHWKDVNWEMNARSLEESSFVSHTFDSRWSKLRAQYAPSSFASNEAAESVRPDAGDEQEDEAQGEIENAEHAEGIDPAPSEPEAAPTIGEDDDVMDILNSIKSESRGPKSHESRPLPGEQEMIGGEIEDPIIKVCEVSYDFDCFEDGIPRRLWMVILPDHDQCIFADFRANICPRAAKPIHLVTVNQVKHRAYGKGLHETYERMADAADRLLCHILLRNAMIANPTTIWNPERTKEGKADPTLKIGEGITYSIEGSQWSPKDIMEFIDMPDLDERTWKLMELFMQLIQVDSGVTNANQGDMTDLPSNTTATGVNSMLESSSVLHQYVLEEIRDSLTPHLKYAIELIYMQQDANETFAYLDQDELPPGHQPDANGNTIAQVMELTDAKKLRGLAMQVEFLLTRGKRQEQREAALAGIPQGVQYGQLSPPDQTRLNDCFVQLFRSLGFDNPDKFFPLPDPNAPPPGPPPPHVTEAVQIPFIALAPNQKDAVAASIGLPAGGAAYPAGPTPPGTPPGSPAPQNAQPLPPNVNPDTGQQPDNQPFVDPNDAAPQPTPPGQ